MTYTTLTLHPILAHLTLITASNFVVRVFSLNFRLHTSLGRETWAKLWYCCRALDQKGKGHFAIPIAIVEVLTGGDEKSIYRWLKDGKRWGAFRRYSCKKGILSVYMGSLFKVSYRLNIKNWGTVSYCNLLDLQKLRAFTTATLTQVLQQKSRYAAGRKLTPQYRKLYGIPAPNQLVPDTKQSSLKPGVGEVPCVLHRSDKRLFVSKGFVPFGTSQKAIAKKQLLHEVTIQRHQRAAGMTRLQLCQAKQEYHWIKGSFEHEIREYVASDSTRNTGLGYVVNGDVVRFSDGSHVCAKDKSFNTWDIPKEDFHGRFFKIGRSMFMAKCNIYRENLELTTMRAARRKYKQLVSQCQFSENRAAGESTDCISNCEHPAI